MRPRNVNDVHKAEQGINTRVAVFLTHIVGSMQTAYLFVLLAFVGLAAILGLLNPLVALLVAWLSQTLIQLVLLPVIMVGQNVLGRHAELMAEEQFQTTQKTYADAELLNVRLAAIERHIGGADDQIIHQILTDVSNGIGKCRTAEEAQRFVWEIAREKVQDA